MTKVMVFGSFDILHPGHIHVFKEAKKIGDYLVVVLARDKTIEKNKQKKPFYGEDERLKMLENISLIDQAVLGDHLDPYKIIFEEKPDIIALGFDQKIFTDKLEEKIKGFNIKTKITRLSPYFADKYSTSNIKDYLDKQV